MTAWLLALGLTATSLVPCRARCTCSYPSDVPRAYAAAAAVLTGIILSVRDSSRAGTVLNSLQVARVVVTEAWKGVAVGDTLDVVTYSTTASCGYPVRPGASHLLYGYREGEASGLWTTSCSLSRPLSAAGDQRRQLAQLPRASPNSQ